MRYFAQKSPCFLLKFVKIGEKNQLFLNICLDFILTNDIIEVYI